ncbi:hypothetical protein H1D32_15015 [Anaerobacillus sp. CMMVII]|uniref:hypothetical protein n=1 Tax=Anaerobacillus sp. CMMVII TaxID=2755588 RepID=UPI0021B7AA2B|nr:hypothetical protein [Anaerobacillus sp. CMMVII]MCT8138906.1 hypothetical protein [Anaerobacillus sp. CMMVII]
MNSMNLMDVLLFQDRNELIKLVKEREVAFNLNSKRELVEVLYPMLLNSEHISAKFDSLTNEAQKIVLALCYDQKLFLSKEELYGLTPSLDTITFQKVIEELTANGFLFCYVNRNYLIPSQIKKQLVRSIHLKIEDYRLVLPATALDAEISIVNDLFVFIDYVQEKPLSLTKTGVIYKKDFQSMMNHFRYKETLPNEQWRFGYGRRFSQYPDRFSLLYDFCFENGWLLEKEGVLTVQPCVEDLYDMRLPQLMKSIITYWQKLYRRPFPTVRLLYQILLDSLTEGEALEEEPLISFLTPFVNEYYFDNKEDIITKRFFYMLEYMDVIKRVEFHNISGFTVGPSLKFLK